MVPRNAFASAGVAVRDTVTLFVHFPNPISTNRNLAASTAGAIAPVFAQRVSSPKGTVFKKRKKLKKKSVSSF